MLDGTAPDGARDPGAAVDAGITGSGLLKTWGLRSGKRGYSGKTLGGCGGDDDDDVAKLSFFGVWMKFVCVRGKFARWRVAVVRLRHLIRVWGRSGNAMRIAGGVLYNFSPSEG